MRLFTMFTICLHVLKMSIDIGCKQACQDPHGAAGDLALGVHFHWKWAAPLHDHQSRIDGPSPWKK